MSIVSKLTLRHLIKNRNRTMITILGIMLSVAMVCSVAGFVISLREMMHEAVVVSRGDYHIAYFGVTPETAKEIAGEPVFVSEYSRTESDGDLVTLYVRFEHPDRDYLEIASQIGDKYEIQGLSPNTELLALEGVIAQSSVMRTFTLIGVIATLIIVIGSIIVIANAFFISSAERVQQFGLLKSVGATKLQIGSSIIFEALVLAVVSIPLGIILGYLIQGSVFRIVNSLLTEMNAMNTQDMVFRVVFDPVVIYISTGIALLTVLISAWLPARRAASTSPIDAIRQTEFIKIRSDKLRILSLTYILFGVEGVLAAKSLKRSRGKYRATVVALTVSIVLFISVSSLIEAMNKGVEMEYGGMDFDVIIAADVDWDKAEEIKNILGTIPDAQVQKYQRIMFETTVPDGFVTENALKEMSENNGYEILLHLIPDTEFVEIAGEDASAILVNTTGPYHSDERIMELVPYKCEIGTDMPLAAQGEAAEIYANIIISDIITEIPDVMLAVQFDGGMINVLVPEKKYGDLYKYSDLCTFYTISTADSHTFCERAGLLLVDYEIIMQDVDQMTRLSRNIISIVRLFGYGFIAMLSLIAVTSVISTIFTSMVLRRQEFAMLYSTGMTPCGMKKMLNLESLLYGIKSLAIGIPIGVGMSLLIHKGMSDTFVFVYHLPVISVLISIITVMLLTFGTMYYGRCKLNKISIVDALRSDIA